MKELLLSLCCLTPLLALADPAAPLPPQLKVSCGDVTIALSARHFWNLNGIWHRGRMVCQQNKGFYGTVLSYKGLGWVGTGHLENKIGETEVEVEFLADGKPLPDGAREITASTFSLKKSSRLHLARLHYELRLEQNRLTERVTLEAETEADLGVLYHFMHPWESSFLEYVMQGDQVPPARQLFSAENERQFVWQTAPDWAALYDPAGKLAVLSVVRSARPLTDKPQWLMWNRGRDRKLYYVPGKNVSLKPGTTSDAAMITTFLTAEPAEWLDRAAAIAAELAASLAPVPAAAQP